MICIKKNDLISLHIVELGAWEELKVDNVVKVLSKFKNATFLGKLFFRFTKPHIFICRPWVQHRYVHGGGGCYEAPGGGGGCRS